MCSCGGEKPKKPSSTSKEPCPESLALARELTSPCGSGDEADAELVAQELAKFPPCVLQKLKDQGAKVKVGRGSVTDCRTDLKGKHPRGWPPGKTWDSVPGSYNPNTKTVTIATTGHDTPAGAHVPKAGEGHGSHNLVLHEAAHALDKSGGKPYRSSDDEFNKARDADLDTLDDYEKQSGAPGQYETYAESAARHYGGDPKDAKEHPNLHKYWESDPACD